MTLSRKVLLPFLLLLASFSASAQRSATPPIPYEDNGACPGECCAYRQWIANKATVLRADRRSNSPVSFTVRKGERVTAITGVLVTTRPGLAKFLRLTAIGGMRAGAGDILYVLNSLGEGWGTIWYKGRFLGYQVDGNPEIKLLSEPQSLWWVKIRNRKGQIGWSNQPENFLCKDECGFEDCPIKGSRMTEQQKPTAVEKPPDRPASTPSLIPTGDVIRIQTRSGVVEVKNFYKTAAFVGDAFVFFDSPGDKNYHIQYDRQDSSFVIQLPIDTREHARLVREIAQAELLEKLGIDKKTACNLTIYVLGPEEFPLVPQSSYHYNYGLSFCPGSKRL